jgi:uncharacterized protein (DUF736 family)
MASQKIGALWIRKTQEGKSFLSGVLNDLSGDIQIAVFRNDRKEKDNQPDYNIVRSEQKEQSKQTANDGFLDEGTADTVQDDGINVDNIPFGN